MQSEMHSSPAQRVFSKDNEFGNFLRRKRMDVLRQELAKHYNTYKPAFFCFVDDSFLAHLLQHVRGLPPESQAAVGRRTGHAVDGLTSPHGFSTS